MNAPSPSQVLVQPTTPLRVQVPCSNVIAEINHSSSESRRIDHGPSVQVRGEEPCGHRLFDLRADADEFRSIQITRKCPRCKLLNDGRVTAIPGRRIFAPGALVGPWFCECGQRLGDIDEIRGRITITCPRGKHKVSVTVADVIETLFSRVNT
jgi:phage FluMu protein Com